MYSAENSPQGAWDNIAEEMLLEFAESGHPTFRATTPLSRGQLKSKGKGKVSIHFSAEPETINTIYRIILSANQLSIYSAVAAICDEYEGQPDNTGEPVILEGQSIVLGEIKAEVPAHNEELEDAKIILQQYFQQVESLSPENRLGKFCKEASFMSVVEVGQYFVTRSANEFLLKTVACREYTLPRDDPASEPKGWIRGNTRIGPILEVTTSIAEKMLLEFAESGCPFFRATTPLSRGFLKSKGRGTLSIQFAADELTIERIFRIIISVNQLSVYGAVAAVCEEFESHQDGSEEPEILMGQSIVLGEIKAEVPLQNENSMNHQILWQQYIERIESLSPESKVSRFCKEAGFMRVVEVGQYLVTKDTGNLRQFRSVACREYTLPRDDPSSQAKGKET